MKKNRFKGWFLILLICAILLNKGIAQPVKIPEIELLFSRLNLNERGLEKVKKSLGNPEKASEALLNYYRGRNSVNHPIDRNNKADCFGHCAGKADFEAADNALKHIFIGQVAYPPHFCGKDIDWSTLPVPDNEWVWQLNRMYFWDSMARVYCHTGDEKYAREWCAQLMDWTRKNPNNEEHKYAWRSIEAGIRGYSWTGLFQRFIDSPHFTPEVLVVFLNSCYDHAAYLMTQYKTLSNWSLMEAEGMAFIAITFPEFKDAEKWRREAFRRLNNEINLQVYPDGFQQELSMSYHVGCIHWFLRTYELAKMNKMGNEFPESYLKKVEKMCEVPMKLCHPDGTNAQYGDDWAGQHSGDFMEWAKKYKRGDFLFLATGGKEGQKPKETAFALKESGFYSMRSGWNKNAVCMVLKCGPDGGFHCQPDNGTFELSAGGRNLMPDAGSYVYYGDPENRAWFRQTKVHQTLTLNGENIRYAPKLVLWRPGDDLDILVVENQSYKNLTHRRSVFFVDKKYFVIVDEASGNANGDVDIHFQLAPGNAIVNTEELSVTSDFNKGWNVLVKTNRQDGIKLMKEEGQVSFVYTKKEPRPAFCYRINKGSDQDRICFVTVVAPYENVKPLVEVKVHDKPSGSSGMYLDVIWNGTKRIVGY